MHTRSMVRVGQSDWDDIKILGHQMGHLISKFQAIWDTSLTCQAQIPNQCDGFTETEDM